MGYFGKAAGAPAALRRLSEGLDTPVVRIVNARPGIDAARAVIQAPPGSGSRLNGSPLPQPPRGRAILRRRFQTASLGSTGHGAGLAGQQVADQASLTMLSESSITGSPPSQGRVRGEGRWRRGRVRANGRPHNDRTAATPPWGRAVLALQLAARFIGAAGHYMALNRPVDLDTRRRRRGPGQILRHLWWAASRLSAVMIEQPAGAGSCYLRSPRLQEETAQGGPRNGLPPSFTVSSCPGRRTRRPRAAICFCPSSSDSRHASATRAVRQHI